MQNLSYMGRIPEHPNTGAARTPRAPLSAFGHPLLAFTRQPWGGRRNDPNISTVSNRYSGYIGNQVLFGWVTQVALSLGIHLAVAGGSRPTLSFLGISEH